MGWGGNGSRGEARGTLELGMAKLPFARGLCHRNLCPWQVRITGIYIEIFVLWLSWRDRKVVVEFPGN